MGRMDFCFFFFSWLGSETIIFQQSMLGKDFTICAEMAILATEIPGSLVWSRGVEEHGALACRGSDENPDPELLSRVRNGMEEKPASSCLLSLEAAKDEAQPRILPNHWVKDFKHSSLELKSGFNNRRISLTPHVKIYSCALSSCLKTPTHCWLIISANLARRQSSPRWFCSQVDEISAQVNPSLQSKMRIKNPS